MPDHAILTLKKRASDLALMACRWSSETIRLSCSGDRNVLYASR
jgi:hypothetical protein